ncbi:MAG: DUF6502 family protein [Steroidobacteraceae bacterium]
MPLKSKLIIGNEPLRSELSLRNACVRLLRPLARIMLRHGLSTYDFSRIANIAFVQAARDMLREQGKPLSFSRVSTITGLHRHVVSEIVNSGSDAGPGSTRNKDYRRNRLARVLSGWFECPTYTDSDGRPRLLQFDGPAPSFTSLVHDFSGDIYPRIILDELLEVGAVRTLQDGGLRAVTRRYTLGGADPATLEQLGQSARDLFNTLEHNIAAPVESRLYDDTVVAATFDRAALPLFRRLLRQRGAAFLEDIEGWISEHEKPESPDTIRAGVTVRMFIDEEKEASDTVPDRRTT